MATSFCLFCSSSLSFDVVFFCLENLRKLCISTNILPKYFPNLFKVSGDAYSIPFYSKVHCNYPFTANPNPNPIDFLLFLPCIFHEFHPVRLVLKSDNFLNGQIFFLLIIFLLEKILIFLKKPLCGHVW